ncbi:Uncharacterised protein [Mycobacteroides abscessus subsp. abscessus]|nr:Uncharacterised protein [Mycobacteroides abscessus subsp. abscessus]
MRATNLTANGETTRSVCVAAAAVGCSRGVWSRLAANLSLAGRPCRAILADVRHLKLASSKYWGFL